MQEAHREQASPGTKRPVLSLEAIREQQPRSWWQRMAEPYPQRWCSGVEGTLFTNTQLAKLTEVMLAVRTPECLSLAGHTHQIHGTRRAFSQPISDTGCYYTHFLSSDS